MSITALRLLPAAMVVLFLSIVPESAAQPSLLWRTNFAGADFGMAFCGVDAFGNIYAASGSTNVVAGKCSPTGTLLWTFRYPGPQGRSFFHNAAIDPSGDIYLAGTAESTLGDNEIVVLKIAANGVPAWTNNISTKTNELLIRQSVELGLDEAGGVHVGGSARNIANTDILLVKLNSSGSIVSQTYFNGPHDGRDELLAMAVDPKTGAAYTALSLVNTNNEPTYVFAKFDATGSLEWIKEAGTKGNSPWPRPQRFVLLSADAGIYFSEASQGRPIVWKYDSAGTLVWKAVYHGAAIANADHQYSAVVDLFGNVTGAIGDLAVHFDRMGVQRWSARIPNARSTLVALDSDTVFARSLLTDGSLLLTRYEQDGSQRWEQATTGSESYPGGFLATNGFCIAADAGTGPAGTLDLFLAMYTTNAGAYGPKILSMSAPMAGALGDPVALSVTAQGTGVVGYQWFQNNAALTDAANASLTFLLSSNTVGNYSVRVTDSVGATISAAIPVLAVFPLSDQWAVLNGTAIFSLRVAGNGVPEGVQWQFNGSDLPGETVPQLKLKNATLAAAGEYTAKFRSGTNVMSKSARLFVTDQVAMEWQKTNDPSGSFVEGEALAMTGDNLGHLAILHARPSWNPGIDLCVYDTNGIRLNCALGRSTDFAGTCRLEADPSGRLYISSERIWLTTEIYVWQFSPLATNFNWRQMVLLHDWNNLHGAIADAGFMYVLVQSSASIYSQPETALDVRKLGGISSTNVSSESIFHVSQASREPWLSGYSIAFVSTNDLVLGWYHGPTNFLTLLSREGAIRWTRETPLPAYGIAVDHRDNILISGAGAGVAQYNAAGDLLWVRCEARWATFDRNDNLYQQGGSHTTKFDSNDHRLWDAPITGGIKFDGNDNVYVSGSLSKSDGTTDRLITKLSTNGVMLWEAVYNGEQDTNEMNGSFEVGDDGAVYLCAADSQVYLVKFVPRDSAGAPTILPSPQVRLVETGASAKLSATVAGTGLAYQWLLDGAPLPGATNQTLTLTNFQPNQAGGYSLRVQNSFGWVIGTETFVTSPLTLFGVAYDLPSNRRSFSFQADALFAYDVQSSTDLVSWTSETNFFGTNGLVGFSRTNHVTPAFYRVQKNR